MVRIPINAGVDNDAFVSLCLKKDGHKIKSLSLKSMNLFLSHNYHDQEDQLASAAMSRDDLYYLDNVFWFQHVLKYCSTLKDLTITIPGNIKMHDNNDDDLQQNDSVERLTIRYFAFSQKNATVFPKISKCLPALKFLTLIDCDHHDGQQPKQEGKSLLHDE